jgi:hypothetical protein
MAANLTFVVVGRVNSLIGTVSPHVTELPAAMGTKRWHLHHDFKANDLPTDPGTKIKTPLRKIVLRLVDSAGFIVAEKAFYVQLKPYWQ